MWMQHLLTRVFGVKGFRVFIFTPFVVEILTNHVSVSLFYLFVSFTSKCQHLFVAFAKMSSLHLRLLIKLSHISLTTAANGENAFWSTWKFFTAIPQVATTPERLHCV